MKLFEDEYYTKMMYRHAGANLLTDNYIYFENLVDKEKTKRISEKIKGLKRYGLSLALYDNIGCSEHKIMENIALSVSEKENVFVIYDDEMNTEKISGIYLPVKSIFVISDRNRRLKKVFTMNVSDLYYRVIKTNHGYTPQQYTDMSDYFFRKSMSQSLRF